MNEPTCWNPTLRTDLWSEADAATAAADQADRRGDRDLARRLRIAADTFELLAEDAGPDINAATLPCQECGVLVLEEHLDGLAGDPVLCQACAEEAGCPCCAALDADDLALAYLIATADSDDPTIPRERAA